MIWRRRAKAIPLDVYHGVPKGWLADEVLAEHARLGGTFDIGGADAAEPGAPNWMPDRNAWLQYRKTLYRVIEGVRANDHACVELAVRYIEMRHIGSYSGFIRSRLSRALKHVGLSKEQQKRLHQHFQDLVLSGERTQECRDYFKLWRQFITEYQVKVLLSQVRGNELASRWLAENLQPNQTL